MGRYVAVVALIALTTAARVDVVAPLTSIPLTFGLYVVEESVPPSPVRVD